MLTLALLPVLAAGPAARAQSAIQTGKGDYKAPAKSHSTVPKSNYLTPKSDRLGPAHDTRSGRLDRLDHGDAVNRDAKFNSELDLGPAVESGDIDALPEIDIPSDPHALPDNSAGTARPSVTTKKRKRRASGGVRQKVDVAVRNGKLRLNNFRTLQMQMALRECRSFAGIFVADYDLPQGSIETLADNMVIVQKRICATNGSVVVTCYQNEATISMRRARPDDGCKRG
jgi:hypothetical protein